MLNEYIKLVVIFKALRPTEGAQLHRNSKRADSSWGHNLHAIVVLIDNFQEQIMKLDDAY